MRRRQLLALSGSLLAGSAGCLSASAPEAPRGTAPQKSPTDGTATDPSDTTTDEPDTTTTSEYGDVSVELDALQPAMVTMTSPDSIGVSRHDDRYLLVDVSAAGDELPPAPEEFSLRVDTETYRPVAVDEPWRFWRFGRDEGLLYDRDAGGGLLLFEFPEPTGASTTAASSTSGESSAVADDSPNDSELDGSPPVLTWPGGEWRPDASLRRRLARPEPPLSASFDVPETVAPGESPAVSVTVENEGDAAGRFVAGLNRIGPRVAYAPVERISLLVPAGESETWEFTDESIMGGATDEEVGDDESDMTYHFDWTDGDVRESVRYVDD